MSVIYQSPSPGGTKTVRMCCLHATNVQSGNYVVGWAYPVLVATFLKIYSYPQTHVIPTLMSAASIRLYDVAGQRVHAF